MVAENLYVQGELVNKRLRGLLPPTKGSGVGHHIFCSPNNIGSLELIQELMDEHKELGRCATTQNLEDLDSCDHMLVYLTGLTWTSGETSLALASEVMKAMDAGINILLAHEMTGVGQEARNGCEFSIF